MLIVDLCVVKPSARFQYASTKQTLTYSSFTCYMRLLKHVIYFRCYKDTKGIVQCRNYYLWIFEKSDAQLFCKRHSQYLAKFCRSFLLVSTTKTFLILLFLKHENPMKRLCS